MKNPEYQAPAVVTLLYFAATIMAVVALCVTVLAMANRGALDGLALFVPAVVIYLIGYAFALLSRILHEVQRIREKVEGTVSVAQSAPGDMPYFLLDHQKSTGPFPLKVLLNRLRMGTLPGNAQVKSSDAGNWIALETLET